MLGHASAAMTLDVYTDLFDDDLDAVAARLEQAVARCKCGQNVGKSPDPDGPQMSSNKRKGPGIPGL